MKTAHISVPLALLTMLAGCFMFRSWPVDEAAVEDSASAVQSVERRLKGAHLLSERLGAEPDMSRWPPERVETHEKARASLEEYAAAERELLTAETALLTVLQDESVSFEKRDAALETARQAEMNAYNALGSAVQALSEWTPLPLPAERETESVGRAAYLEAFDRLRAAERELEQGNGSEEELLAAVQEAREAFWTVKDRAGVLVWGWEPSDTFEPADYAGSPLERAERKMERALRETQKYAVYTWESPYRDLSLRRRGWYYPERRWNAERIAQHKAIAQAALRWSLAARDWRDALIAGASDKETAEAEERMDGLRAQWDAARQSPKFLKPRLDWERREEIRCADEVLKNAYKSVDAHMISTNMFLWDAEKMEQLDLPPKEKRAEFRADMEKLAYYLHHLCAAKVWRSTLTDINASEDAKRIAQSEASLSRFMDGPFEDNFRGHMELYGFKDDRVNWEQPMEPLMAPTQPKKEDAPASAGR